MKRILFFAFLALVLLTGCYNDNDYSIDSEEISNETLEEDMSGDEQVTLNPIIYEETQDGTSDISDDTALDLKIYTNTSIKVAFEYPMIDKTVTTNTENSGCSGSVQLSNDEYLTCAQMLTQPVPNYNSTIYTIMPAPNLEINETYKLRITDRAVRVEGTTVSFEEVLETVSDETSDVPAFPISATRYYNDNVYYYVNMRLVRISGNDCDECSTVLVDNFVMSQIKIEPDKIKLSGRKGDVYILANIFDFEGQDATIDILEENETTILQFE
jgi:hypothetical protein